jgi:hypothetical protein
MDLIECTTAKAFTPPRGHSLATHLSASNFRPVGRYLRLVLDVVDAVAHSLAHAVLEVRGRLQLVRRVRARSLVDVGARVLYVPLETSHGKLRKSPWLSAVFGADTSYPPSSHTGVASQQMS